MGKMKGLSLADKIILILIAYCIIREVIFLYTVHKLVNKVMSGSFYEYQQAKAVGKKREDPPIPVAPMDENDYPQELGYLNEILS